MVEKENQEQGETETTQQVQTGGNVFELVQVPTQHQLMVQTPEGEVISIDQLIVNNANEIRAIKKGIVG